MLTLFRHGLKSFGMKSFHRLPKEVGMRVLIRENNKCTSCGSCKNLCIHHIERMKPDDDGYCDESNLTVLCRPCHMSYHRLSGHIVTSGNKHGNPNGRRGTSEIIFCKFDGCGRAQHAQKMCKKHYMRFLRASASSNLAALTLSATVASHNGSQP